MPNLVNNMNIKKGDIVKMSWKLRFALLKSKSFGHLFEFAFCKGIVGDLVNYNNDNENHSEKLGPEINVRWQPSNLRYCYLPEELIRVID